MKTTLKAKFNEFLEGPVPLLVVATVASAAIVVVYHKYAADAHISYEAFLETKAELLANALDQTTEHIISNTLTK